MNIISLSSVYFLGITNIITGLLVLFSCRCFVGVKFYILLLQKPWFKKFYAYHCWYWRLFFISVFLHTVIAFMLFGLPF